MRFSDRIRTINYCKSKAFTGLPTCQEKKSVEGSTRGVAAPHGAGLRTTY